MTTPPRLVESGSRHHGWFDARPSDVNPADEFSGLRRRWHDFRTKEWVGFTLVHPELYGAMIIQDAKYLSSSEFYVRDRASGRLTEFAATARGGFAQLPRILLEGGHCEFVKPGYAVRYDFDDAGGSHRVRFELAATASSEAVSGELLLDVRQASPALSMSARMPRRSTLYTHKRIFPASGHVTVGSRTYGFHAAEHLVIIDEHRSQLAYRTEWTWGTFAVRLPDGVVGANFATRPQLPDEFEESGVWTPEAAEPLHGIRFTPDPGDRPADLQAPVTVVDADGRLDLVFTPDGHKAVRHQLVVAAIRYAQMYGSYSGTIRARDGREWAIEGVPGVLERMDARM
ncbi:DUF2804 domain-containing protein [Blastococcus sp. TF02-8]|uniref:DUF2804 family protein n=1 Tax=Blastococcus sp. TF02-8 TaxID=2250574 RepID=UPI000DE94216|nr:DUF2804 family protein [Blastococcus sp. TF02-8]RBY93735.1 DUF2804 domain-containing protein [Blastococcus sp. TF02-8]